MRVIGDVHGKYDDYKRIAEQSPDEYSVQIGDFGFDYSILDKMDSSKHKIIGGNHDDYDNYYDYASALGDYGTYSHDTFECFYIRGSISIDCLSRVKNYILSHHKTWWYEEELSDDQITEAIDLYEQEKPSIVLSHDCPTVVKNQVSNPEIMQYFGWPDGFTCRTQQALQIMLNIHRPDLWIFGHFHKSWHQNIGGTDFVCLDELEYIDI